MSDDTSCLDRFRYDYSFGTKSDTLTVYDTVCRGVVDGVLQGLTKLYLHMAKQAVASF